ncbi:MAG: hypothetical protein ACFCU3_00985 [Verrucomicrobiales bacterium]
MKALTLQRLKQQTEGNVLVVTMFFAAILASWAAASFSFTGTSTVHTARSTHYLQTKALAEGVLEIAFTQWRRYMENNVAGRDSIPAEEFAFITDPESRPNTWASLAEHFEDYEFTRYEVFALDQDGQRLPPDEAPEGIVVLDRSQGWAPQPIRRFNYLALVSLRRASVRGPGIEVTLGRTFSIEYTNIVGYAIFYEGIMEIHNGPDMDIIGLIHGNSRIYMGGGGEGKLTLWDKVTAVGGQMEHTGGYGTTLPNDHNVDDGIYNFAYENSKRGNDGTIMGEIIRRGIAEELGAGWRETGVARKEAIGINPNELMELYPGNPNVAGGGRELIERPNADYADPQEIADRRFYNQADLRILIDSTRQPGDPARLRVVHRGVELSSVNEDGIVEDPVERVVYQSLGLADESGVIISSGSNGGGWFIDKREGQKKDVRGSIFSNNLDIGFLSAEMSSDPEFNGVIYVTDVSASSVPTPYAHWDPTLNEGNGGYRSENAQKAIRLFNGAELSGRTDTNGNLVGLTVASDTAIYVQGDYNVGKDPLANEVPVPYKDKDKKIIVDSRTPTAADALEQNEKYEKFMQGDGYERIPALIAADAITVLSNAWTDPAWDTTPDQTPAANSTSINAAFLTGNVQDERRAGYNGGYSGGVENFPRFLENWGGQSFNYYGSMIQLFESEVFNGKWGASGVYNPPTRRWYHERAFLDPSFVIPGVTIPVSYERGPYHRFSAGEHEAL